MVSLGLFRRKRASAPEPEPVEERSTLADLLSQVSSSYQFSTSSGVDVSLDSALKNMAVWACQRALTAEISKLPIDQYRNRGRGRQEMPLSPVVASPSGSVSRRGWVGQVVRSLVSAGNAYGIVTATDSLGRATQIDTLNPQQVLYTGGKWLVDGVQRYKYPLGDLWHVAVSGYLVGGSPVALSPTRYAAESIGTGLAAERWGGSFFEGGGFPSVLMQSTNQKLTAEQADVAKQRVVAAGKRGQPFVMDASWTLKEFQVEPSSTQFLDLLRFEVEQACRAYGVPPSMAFASISGVNMTYANVTQSDLHFLKHAIEYYLIDLEDAWSALLPQPQYVKFKTDAVLRMDKRARSEEHDIRLKNRTRTVNEVRLLEDEEPFDDPMYDEPGIPGGPVADSGGAQRPDPTQGGAQ